MRLTRTVDRPALNRDGDGAGPERRRETGITEP